MRATGVVLPAVEEALAAAVAVVVTRYAFHSALCAPHDDVTITPPICVFMRFSPPVRVLES